jgi:hypothetical protein
MVLKLGYFVKEIRKTLIASKCSVLKDRLERSFEK